MVIRCFGDDLAGFVDDDLHAPPPMQRAGQRSRDGTQSPQTSYSNLVPAPAFQPMEITGFRIRRAPQRLGQSSNPVEFLALLCRKGSRVFAACSSDRSSDGRAATQKACARWIIKCPPKTCREPNFLRPSICPCWFLLR